MEFESFSPLRKNESGLISLILEGLVVLVGVSLNFRSAIEGWVSRRRREGRRRRDMVKGLFLLRAQQ